MSSYVKCLEQALVLLIQSAPLGMKRPLPPFLPNCPLPVSCCLLGTIARFVTYS